MQVKKYGRTLTFVIIFCRKCVYLAAALFGIFIFLLQVVKFCIFFSGMV